MKKEKCVFNGFSVGKHVIAQILSQVWARACDARNKPKPLVQCVHLCKSISDKQLQGCHPKLPALNWEMRLSINLQMKARRKQRTLTTLTHDTHWHWQAWDSMGLPCSGFVSWCVTGSLHRQHWELCEVLPHQIQQGPGTTDKRACTETHIEIFKTQIPWPSPRDLRCQVELHQKPSHDWDSKLHLIFQALNPRCFLYLVIACPTSCITSEAAVKKDKNKTAKQPQHSMRHPANASNLLAYMYNIIFKN